MRLPLIPLDTLTAEQKTLYADMKNGIQNNFKGFTAINEEGPWNPWLRFPQFGRAVWDYTKAMSASPKLPRTVREIAILVTGTKFHAAYELYAHVIVAELRGLPDEKITTIISGHRPSDLTSEETIAYDLASSLVTGSTLPTLTYKRAVGAFGEDGAAEFIYLVGLYCAVSVILNGFDVPLPEDGTAD
ncbi:MAG TPA: carboxymuconolactone decarboxylase family protein [Hyphomicrobium sp.]|nr:carboxymuconolactone decarboxylase family protein [Hyphomicrobium sp.]